MVRFNRSILTSRRSFIEKLGLGVGAALLAPLGMNLITEARGQAVERKLAMFWLAGNGINPFWVFTPKDLPKEFQEDISQIENQQEPGEVRSPDLVNTTQFTLPDAFQPLAPYRNQLALLEGFKNNPRKGEDAGHGAGFMALSCVPGADNDHLVPGGITLDQQLAKSISANTPKRSILIGQSSQAGETVNTLFARGPSEAVPAYQSPAALYRDMFAGLTPPPAMTGSSAGQAALNKNRLLFDAIRGDIALLESSFAAEERIKLARYLEVIEDYEKGLSASLNLSCDGGPMPQAGELDPVDAMVALNALASVAMVCGMTNVMGVNIGTMDSHDYGPNLSKLHIGRFTKSGMPLENANGTSLGDVGHEQADINEPVISGVYQWMTAMSAATLEKLKQIPSGNGTLFDSTLAMFTSDNGETHHSNHQRWNLALVGKIGSLKLQGQYVRYPGSAERSLLDVYTAVLEGFGVSASGFGVHQDGLGPNVRAQGPLPELI